MNQYDERERINLRLSREEKEMIKKHAEHFGISVKKLMVTSTLHPIQLPEVQREIKKQGQYRLSTLFNNLQAKKLPEPYLKIIKEEIQKLWEI
ncbi:MAG: hypothetical protein Q4F03_00005 [Eubacteriales bacterium]|nr:hypothetical protein [Eubacteriales bacterium]